jgi:hypothetical protein
MLGNLLETMKLQSIYFQNMIAEIKNNFLVYMTSETKILESSIYRY